MFGWKCLSSNVGICLETTYIYVTLHHSVTRNIRLHHSFPVALNLILDGFILCQTNLLQRADYQLKGVVFNASFTHFHQCCFSI